MGATPGFMSRSGVETGLRPEKQCWHQTPGVGLDDKEPQ